MGKIKKKKKIIRKPIGWLGRPSTIYKTEIEKIFLIPFLFLLIIPFSLGQITIGNNNENLPKVEVGMSEGTGNYYYNITNLTQFINTFDQDLNTTNDVIFNTVHANNLCYSNGTSCSNPYQSSAGGWTNDSINTNTSKQVYINNDTYLTGTLTIENNQIVLKNATGFTTINITPSGQIIFNTRGSTTNPLLKFSGAFANTGWYDNGYGTSFEISGSPLFTISGDSGFVASAGIGTFKVSNGAQTMTFRPDTNNVMAIRQGRYATHTYGGLNIYAYAIDQSVPTLNFSRLMFIANATHPNFIIKGENNGYCPNCFAKNLTIDFPEADFTGDVDVNGTLTTVNGNFTGNITIQGNQGLTTNKLINGSTSQCWLNYTSGLLTASDC